MISWSFRPKKRLADLVDPFPWRLRRQRQRLPGPRRAAAAPGATRAADATAELGLAMDRGMSPGGDGYDG